MWKVLRCKFTNKNLHKILFMERSTGVHWYFLFSSFLCVIYDGSLYFCSQLKRQIPNFAKKTKTAIIFFLPVFFPISSPPTRISSEFFLQIHLENPILNWFSPARNWPDGSQSWPKTESYCSLVRNGSSVGSFVRTAHERRVKKREDKVVFFTPYRRKEWR